MVKLRTRRHTRRSNGVFSKRRRMSRRRTHTKRRNTRGGRFWSFLNPTRRVHPEQVVAPMRIKPTRRAHPEQVSAAPSFINPTRSVHPEQVVAPMMMLANPLFDQPTTSSSSPAGVQCPEWLAEYSDLVKSAESDEPFLAGLPVCDENEKDADKMHEVLRAWLVSFDNMVHHTPFLKLWFALSKEERRQKTSDPSFAYASELDVGTCIPKVVDRDDSTMLLVALESNEAKVIMDLKIWDVPPPDSTGVSARMCVEMAAVECLKTIKDFMKWTKEDMRIYVASAVSSKSQYGHLVCAQDKTPVRDAHMLLFQYLLDDIEWKDDYGNACPWAAIRDNIVLLKYLHKKGCRMDQETATDAIKGHSMDCLRYTHENNCLIRSHVKIQAAMSGNLEALRYFHENINAEWFEAQDGNNCMYAAKYGHVDCLQFAHEHGCSWNKVTCEKAAQGGHLQCLQYAHEQGCPWENSQTIGLAAIMGHLECMKYAHKEGCPWLLNVFAVYHDGDRASVDALMPCLKYAHENECPWDHLFCERSAGKGGDWLPIIQYARENGCPWNKQKCILAATEALHIRNYMNPDNTIQNQILIDWIEKQPN